MKINKLLYSGSVSLNSSSKRTESKAANKSGAVQKLLSSSIIGVSHTLGQRQVWGQEEEI